MVLATDGLDETVLEVVAYDGVDLVYATAVALAGFGEWVPQYANAPRALVGAEGGCRRSGR